MPVAATFDFRDSQGRSLATWRPSTPWSPSSTPPPSSTITVATTAWPSARIGLDDDDDRGLVDLLAEQIEFANVLVINKCDQLEADELAHLRAILTRLNPNARLLETRYGKIDPQEIIGARRYDPTLAAESPGWAQELAGGHVPETEEYGIGSMVYRARRPFHPQRLYDVLDSGVLAPVLRAKGFMWVATQPHLCGTWSQAGSSLTFGPSGIWYADLPRDDWPDDGRPSSLDQGDLRPGRGRPAAGTRLHRGRVGP